MNPPMTTDAYRVVRTLAGADGPITLASGPIPRDVAMSRFDDMVSWGMDRVRVVRDQDHKPS